MSLESRYSYKVVLHRPGGDLDTGPWETKEGGNITSEASSHRNAVTRRKTARGGPRSRTSATLGRECDAATWAIMTQLEDSAGRDRCTLLGNLLGPRGEVVQVLTPITGVFMRVDQPSYDIDGDGIGMCEIEIDCDE